MDLRVVNEAKTVRAQTHVDDERCKTAHYLESKQNVLVRYHGWVVGFKLGDHELQHL